MRTLLVAIAACTLAGCSAFPDVIHQPQLHNPFPQLSQIAVIPFANQSAEPTLNGDQVALAYYNELQSVPGFDVMPVGVAKVKAMEFEMLNGEPTSGGENFQKLAQFLGVDVVVVGAVTEYSAYYPPRLGLNVRWYAANPGYHPIPAGYGLPWGTAEEEYIPDSLVFEAEFELAKQQLKTQSPPMPDLQMPTTRMPANPDAPKSTETIRAASLSQSADASSSLGIEGPYGNDAGMDAPMPGLLATPDLPENWPDPRGFLPPAPTPFPAIALPQSSPVLSLTRLYHGNDSEFTEQLANYYYFRDDARFGGWQSYLQRSEDFIRFCCHLHVTELLAARGGAGKTRVVWRWPIGRYDR
jgi:hypothetical protein